MLPVLLAALLAFIVWLDTDFHHTRQQIESSFKQITGHNLLIKGGLSLEFWPATRFVSRQVEVIDQQGQVLFTAEKLAAEVVPISIFSGKLMGESLVLEKVQVNAVHEAADNIAPGRKHKTVSSNDQQSRISSVPFKSIRVIDSAIHVDDRINSKRYELNNLQIAIELVSDHQMTINGSLDFIYDNSFKGSFTTSSSLNPGEQLVFEEVVAQLDLIVRDKPISLKASGAFSLEPDGQLIQISEAALVSKTLALQASIKGRHSHDNLLLEVQIDHLNPLMAVMAFSEPDSIPNQGKALQSLSAEIRFEKSASEMRIDIASLKLDNSLAQGSMVFSDNTRHFQFKIDELVIDPYLKLLAELEHPIGQSADDQAEEIIFAIQFDRLVSEYGAVEELFTKVHLHGDKLHAVQGKLNAQRLNLNSLLKSYVNWIPKTKFVSKLQRGNEFSLIDGQLEFVFTNEVLSVSDLDLTIDDTLIKGELEYAMKPPRLNAQLQLGKLDLDRYHYLFDSEDDAGESNVGNEVNPADMFQSLKSLQGSGSIKIEKLRYQQTDYQKMDIQFNDG